jgi:hypothetical protein
MAKTETIRIPSDWKEPLTNLKGAVAPGKGAQLLRSLVTAHGDAAPAPQPELSEIPASWEPLLRQLADSTGAELGERFLREAIALAQNWDPEPEPNPTVTVILKNEGFATVTCLGQRWPVDKPIEVSPEQAELLESEFRAQRRYASAPTFVERVA